MSYQKERGGEERGMRGIREEGRNKGLVREVRRTMLICSWYPAPLNGHFSIKLQQLLLKCSLDKSSGCRATVNDRRKKNGAEDKWQVLLIKALRHRMEFT